MASTAPAGGLVRTQADPNANYTFALSALTSLFFMWGFITCLNDILIPHLKAVFTLNYTQSMLIQFCFFAAYFIMSLPAGNIIEKIGYRKGIVLGLVVAGLGCVMFYPAAGRISYPLFLAAFFVLASGITILQVAANPYVTILGAPAKASSRLNMTQAFNSLGTTIAPYLGSIFILGIATKTAEDLARLSDAELLAHKIAEASSVQLPYLGLAAVLFLIAAAFAVIKLPEIEAGNVDPETGEVEYDPGSAWGYRHLKLGALGIFLYVGAEVSIGSFLVNFIGQSYIAGLPEAQAAKYVSFYWGGAMIGRFLGSAIQARMYPAKLLAWFSVAATLLTAATMIFTGKVAMWSVLSIGLFNSIMFPTIFSLALAGLGSHTGKGSGILCAAIVGGAVVPVLQGMLADGIGIHHAFILPLCYLYIVHYALSGHHPRHISDKA
jgi:FHS family L-fucose permease-like MFS transporter